MVPLNDSTTVVQVLMPEQVKIAENQIGVVRGIYRDGNIDTAQKGYGRCSLIKGDYYYFAIKRTAGSAAMQEGDLLYTFWEKPSIYMGQAPRLAAHYIRLKDVMDLPFYDRFFVFDKWTEQDEEKFIDSLVGDIRYTGEYFRKNNPDVDQVIAKGTYSGKKVLDLMQNCNASMVKDFLSYMLARPRNYAGQEWKVTEIFATWLTAGAPVPVKE